MLPYTPADVDAVRTAVGDALAGGPVATCSSWTPVQVKGFLAAAHRHRVTVFLEAHSEELELPDGVRRNLGEAARSERIASLLLARETHRVSEILRRAGVDAIAMKGVALASMAYGDFTLRGSGDVDVLIRPQQAREAHAALREEGWQPDLMYPRPGPTWAWRFTFSNYFEVPLAGPNGVAADLHWYPVPARRALPQFDELWERSEEVMLGPLAVRTLSPNDALAHSASHAARDEWAYLRSLVDVVLLRRIRTPGRNAWLTAAGERTVRVAEDIFTGSRTATAVDREKALRTQETPPDRSAGRFPGHRTVLHVRRSATEARSLGDVKRALATGLVHPSTLGDVASTTALGGWRAVVRRRASTFARRWRDWRLASP